jgi:RimJ/RimL family protein N-acetyltransferase
MGGSDLEQVWPPFRLRVTSGPLELGAIRDDDIPALTRLALAGIHDPAMMPFTTPWTDAPSRELPAAMAAYYWRTRAAATPEHWVLDLVVRVDGEIVGTQGATAHDFPSTRRVETGSWLGRRHQGRGIGTRMRRAICALLIDHLGAREVTSSAWTDNPASYAVSRKVGYADNGSVREARRPGEVATSRKLLLTPGAFVRGPDPVDVAGAEALRRFLGLA